MDYETLQAVTAPVHYMTNNSYIDLDRRFHDLSADELEDPAPFIGDLAKAFPKEVDEVLGQELRNQLSMGAETQYLPLLQDLGQADHAVKEVMKPRLLAALSTWPQRCAENVADRWAHHLNRVLRVLHEVCNAAESATVAAQCATRYQSDPASPSALVWLRELFPRDPAKAAEILASGLTKGSSKTRQERAIRMFGTLFGDHDAVAPQIEDVDQRARVFGLLVRSAYTLIRPDDDIEHEGIYTPNIRDHAERARNFLLTVLLETPGLEAQRTILALAKERDFAHFPDHLRLLARRRAAADAEIEPYSTEAVVTLERRHELSPHDRDGMFTVMMDRLDDLQREISHHDFSDRRTIRKIRKETEMQRTLAYRLHLKANGAYSITREEEVADGKKTDIRFLSNHGPHKAVAEVKIADVRWSVTQLERALMDQLRGQYLRHEHCSAGCLLLTYNGVKRKYWLHPRTKRRLGFSELVEHLSRKARSLEEKNNWEVRLAVFGLDLTDPPLVAAHRRKRARK